MKILYAIQGTGNGHICRAKEIIPILEQKNIELDILISGTQADVKLAKSIKYQFKGLSFIFGKKGGIDIWKTYLKTRIKRFKNEINSLPIQQYDLVINDFEPVSAWAAKLHNIPCISFSHQAAVLNKQAPQPKSYDIIGKTILKKYAPTDFQYGLHFEPYTDSIFKPIIRTEIRNATLLNKKHYTVYLPSYSNKKLIKHLSAFETIQWEVFSKHTQTIFQYKNILIKPITNESFIKSIASCTGVLCGAGFETPAETLFMKKKLLVIPMKGQYEQQCNAVALKKTGVPIIKSLKKKHHPKIKKWLTNDTRITVDYPDQTNEIIDLILNDHKKQK